ncbi:MAG: hypothetical protein LBP73_10080 [Clostridiales Family XIII bacterium]|jgi:predicted esterase YcpF (UPF0227 family)|nr:hypothetical protein [Clostridiales Family XIII bacterium]
MILHVHGYDQHHDNLAFRILSREIKESGARAVIMPFMDYRTLSPNGAMECLLEICKTRDIPRGIEGLVSGGAKDEIELITGYSLGGFFAYCLKSMLDVPVLLINPCLAPFMYLHKWTNGDFPCEYERQYAELFAECLYRADTKRLRAIVGKNDAYIDHAFTKRLLPPETVDAVDLDHNLSLASACIQILEHAIFDSLDY